jgi:O-antigen/teichoic acid export membrane protein
MEEKIKKEITEEDRAKIYLKSTIIAGVISGVIIFIIIAFFSLKWAIIISVGYVLVYWFFELFLKFKLL